LESEKPTFQKGAPHLKSQPKNQESTKT